MSCQPFEYGLQPPAALFELAASMRNAIEKMLVIDQPHEELRRARREIDDIARRLETIGRKGSRARMLPSVDPGPEDLRPYFAGDATRWHYNPLNPPLRLEVDAGVLRGTVTLGLAYEGPPGCAHGGFISMLLDQLLGQANVLNGVPAMTASLTVRYLRPTPLLTELSFEAQPPEMIEERKYVTRGCIRWGQEVTAEARGLFVFPNSAKFDLPDLSVP